MKKLVSYQFDGGYASFANGSYSDWHYYIQDYMGNVRMVVNRDGTVEQKTHYYPYGGVIGDISTNHSFQKYKFEGKELDRQFGLDWYDIHARQYDAIGVPAWNKVDALAEEYPHLSPYVFAGGNPVNYGDYNGLDTYKITNMGVIDYTIDDNHNSLFIGGNQMYLNIGQSDLLKDLFINQQKNGFGSDAVGISSFSNGLNTKNTLSLFEFICDNTEVEWSLYSIGKGKEGYFQLGTTNNVEKCPSNSDLNRVC